MDTGILKSRLDANGVPEVTCAEVQAHQGQVRLVDVRRPDEYTGELGHIAGAELITLGPDLMQFLSEAERTQEIVFICRSGARSGQATQISREMGFTKTFNMAGGMLQWNEEKREIRKGINT